MLDLEVVETFLTPKQAAQQLGVRPDYVADLARAGVIAGLRTGLGYLLDPASVEAFAAQRATAPRYGRGRRIVRTA